MYIRLNSVFFSSTSRLKHFSYFSQEIFIKFYIQLIILQQIDLNLRELVVFLF